ncbi:MAG: AAA family ATPase [Planctomycetaceae bacterium]
MDTSHFPLIQSLLNPARYSHPCTHVELVETHISWVLLTGLRAYKIKKPVDLGFADFTTLKRRRHFCEEELRLNRRLAPDLYLDVVPITGTPQQPQFAGPEPVIEYAVMMRQFDQSRLLSNLSLAELPARMFDDLADQCASLHLGAACCERTADWGTADLVMKSVRDNFEVLRNVDALDGALVQTLTDQVACDMEQLGPVLEDRRRNGMIRECHGDLHLGNMFLHGDRIIGFDGIEFNEELRWIDIVNDIAFTVMDLDDRQAAGLANRFLNRWLERTGDYAGLNVLRFYCAYRAAVRAKVDAIRMQQTDVSLADQRHLANDCHGYLELAVRYGQQSHPWLAITMGLSGSGKTTVTQRLIESTNVIRLRSDVERKRLYGLSMEASSDAEQKSQMYSDDASAATYQRLAKLAEDILNAGFPVVIDATFLRRAERTRFRELAQRRNVPFRILQCEADLETLRNRIRERQAQNDASEADESVLDSQVSKQEPPTAQEEGFVLKADREDLADAIQAGVDG